MILCLDVGNSQILGGLFQDEKIVHRFRKSSKFGNTSDEMGLFLKNVIREQGYDPNQIKAVAYCSVVPELNYSLTNAIKKYFDCEPFVLGPGVKSGLKIKYKNPVEVGADRIANSIAAVNQWPQKNLIIADLGTATTLCVVSQNKEYLGGVIFAGIRLCMEALESKTAKLPTVEILQPTEALGRSTVESIQSGLFYGHYHMLSGVVESLKKQCFADEEVVVVGTGGFSRMFEKTNLFQKMDSDLVLKGVYQALKMNL